MVTAVENRNRIKWVGGRMSGWLDNSNDTVFKRKCRLKNSLRTAITVHNESS